MKDVLLTTKDLAELTGERAQTWRLRRMRGDGPPFVRIGGRAYYDRLRWEQWLRERTFQSTSEESTRRTDGSGA